MERWIFFKIHLLNFHQRTATLNNRFYPCQHDLDIFRQKIKHMVCPYCGIWVTFGTLKVSINYDLINFVKFIKLVKNI